MNKKCVAIFVALVLMYLLGCTSCTADTDFMGVVYQWTNWNTGGVQNGPPAEDTVFRVNEPVTVTYLDTYHWNYGQGTDAPGAISLVRSDGVEYGPFWMDGKDGMGGVPNAWWYLDLRPGELTLPAGTYTVVDSDPDTWANNAQSDNAGFFAIKWTRTGSSTKPTKGVLTITSISAPSTVSRCGARETMNVYWKGDPIYPIKLRYQPVTTCPPGYGNCESPEISFNSYQNPLPFPDSMWCCGGSGAYFDYEVVLINGDGTKSKPYHLPVTCK